MLLPTKGIGQERALITIGGEAIHLLDTPTSVSGLWERHCQHRASQYPKTEPITFDWFSLGLATAYALGAIAWTSEGLLCRTRNVPE
jgi:hypothetical protein